MPIRIRAVPKPGAPDGHLATPWFARDGRATLDGPPALLTFAETDFLERFFAGIDARQTGTRSPFPKLVPLRDWSEPPRAMRDAVGRPLFPAAIHRAPIDPGAAVPEGSTLPEQVIAAEEASSGTGWFRKLYLPSHRHFHLVAAEVVCERGSSADGDRPSLDPKRIVEAGAVIRRLVPGSDPARWEDWIPAEKGRGVWAEIATAAMTGASARPIDPSRPEPVPALETALRLRLGLALDAPVPPLDPVKLAPVPPAQSGGRTVRFAYLPVSSSDVELADDARTGPPSAAQMRAEAADKLDASLGADTVAVRDRARAAWSALISALSGPSSTTSRFGPDPGDHGASALASLQIAVDAAWSAPDPHVVLALPSAGQLATWLRETSTHLVGGVLDAPRWTGSDSVASRWRATFAPWAAAAMNDALCGTALRGALQQALESVLASALGTSPSDRHRLLASILLWVRAHRILLHRSVQSVLPAPTLDDLTPEARTTADPHAPGTLVPLLTVGSLGGELEAFVVAEEERARTPRPWPPISLTGTNGVHIAIHRACLALEEALAELERRGGAGGSGWAAMREARAAALRGSAGLQRSLGIDLDAQPENGLVALDALHFDARWASLRTEVLSHYVASPALDAEARARQVVVRPRFDPDHLYAVWVFARISDGRPCRAERVVWSAPTEVFAVADPNDLLGMKPVAMRLPDLASMLRDLPRIARAQALPVAAITTPPDSGYVTGDDPKDTAREWGIAWICSFGIPVFTICAWILFKIILAILLMIPGFGWMLLLKFCLPVPAPRSS